MGLTQSYIRLLARQHKLKPFQGPVLTLGRQAVYATYEQVREILISEGIEPQPLDPNQPLTTNIPTWIDATDSMSKFTSDHVVFQSLAGLSVFALDVSDYENADYVADLNFSVPNDLAQKFGLIIDGGTLEHVFDVKQALQNVNCMLKPGGTVIHISPGSNCLGHGFYQFSPTLFYDYYGVNGFTNLEGFILEVKRANFQNNYNSKCDCWKWDFQQSYPNVIHNQPIAVYFSAKKTNSSKIDNLPQQGDFSGQVEGGKMGNTTTTEKAENVIISNIKDLFPQNSKNLIKRLLRRDLNVKPWGLKYVGKF
jgi:SAM-dependent methyltransferase